jgi:Secretion system C-terminal sorting domain/Bacterial Ig-like domain (group 2)
MKKLFILSLVLLFGIGKGFSTTNSVTLSSSGPAAGNICVSTSNAELYSFDLTVAGTPATTVTQLSFTPAGTFAAGEVVEFELWRTSVGGTPIATVSGTAIGASSPVNFSSLSEAVSANTTYYITATIASSVVNGHTISVPALAATNFTTTGATSITNGATSAGGTQTIHAAPAAITGATPLCTGNTSTFTDAIAGGTWSSSATAIATVNASGVVTAVAQGLANITYTTGCGTDAVLPITVNGVPSSITGTLLVCMPAASMLSCAATGGTWTSFNTSIATVAQDGTVTSVDQDTVTIQYANTCGAATTVVTVHATPSAIAGNYPLCTTGGVTDTLINTSIGGTWSNSNTATATLTVLNGDTAIVHIAGAGFTTVTYSTGCGTPATTKITVSSAAPDAANFNVPTLCTETNSNISYVSTGSHGVWSSQSSAVASITATSITTDTITIAMPLQTEILYDSIWYNNGCGIAVTVLTINPTPHATITGAGDTVCNGATQGAISFTTTDTVATSYTWTNNDNTIGWGAGSTTTTGIASFAAVNGGTNGLVAVFTVHPVAGGCAGPAAVASITVDPTPTLNTLSDSVFCEGTFHTLHFSGTSANTIYSWTNNNTNTGIGQATGVGNYGFTTNNGGGFGTTDIVSQITVTPKIGACSGTAQSMNVTIHPVPVMNSVGNLYVCNKDTLTIAFSGNTAALNTYPWVGSNAVDGVPASGTGNIFDTFINTTSLVLHDTIVVTPTIGACAGANDTFVVNIKPTPKVTGIADTLTYCYNEVHSLTMVSVPSGAGFRWQNSNSTEGFVGLSASGTGNSIPLFIAHDTLNYVSQNILSVHDSLNGCSFDTSFVLQSAPTPSVNTPTSLTVNNGSTIPAIYFTGITSPNTYTWTNSDTTIGLAATGTTDSLPTFIATDTFISDRTATIIVTPKIGTCAGTAANFTITVRATSSLSISGDTTTILCNGTQHSVINLSTANADSFKWTVVYDTLAGTGFDATIPVPVAGSIGLGDTGTEVFSTSHAASLTFGASVNNPYSSIMKGTIIVTPYSASGAGHSVSIPVKVYPVSRLSIDSGSNIPVSGSTVIYTNGDSVDKFSFLPGTDTTGTYTYTWAGTSLISNTAGGVGISGAGSSISRFMAINMGTADILDTITVTPHIASCAGTSNYFKILVHPTPSVAAYQYRDSVCNGDSISPLLHPIYFATGSDNPTKFIWSVDTLHRIGIPDTGTAMMYNKDTSFFSPFIASNTSDTVITETIKVIAIDTTNPSKKGDSLTLTISVRPTPRMNHVTPIKACDGNTINKISFTGTTGVLNYYTWYQRNPYMNLINATSITADTIGSFTVTTAPGLTDTDNVDTVIVMPHIGLLQNAQPYTCYGTPDTFTITVHPKPRFVPGYDASLHYFCNNLAVADTINLSTKCDSVAYTWHRIQDTNRISAAGNDTSVTSVRTTVKSVYFNNGINLTNKTVDSVNPGYVVILKSYYMVDTMWCQSAPDTVKREFIYPTPKLNIASTRKDTTVCDAAPITIGLTSATDAYLKVWYYTRRDSVVGIVGTKGYSLDTVAGANIISEALDNNLLDSSRTVTYRDSLVLVMPNNAPCFGIDSNKVTVHPTPMLVVTRDTICSGDVLVYPASGRNGLDANVKDTRDSVKGAWSVIATNTQVLNMAGVSDSLDTIHRRLFNQYYNQLDSIKFNYVLSVKYNGKNTGCTNNDTLTTYVKPRPSKPVIAPVAINGKAFDTVNLYNNIRNVNFTDSSMINVQNYLAYSWSASSALIIKQSLPSDPIVARGKNAVVTFDSAGRAVITDSVWYGDATGENTYKSCAVDSMKVFNVKQAETGNAADSIYIIYYSDIKTMICMNNTTTPTTYSYLWGFDDTASLQPHLIKDATGSFKIDQDLVINNLFSDLPNSPVFDTSSISEYAVWVQTTRQVVVSGVTETYVQKTYYNPTTGQFKHSKNNVAANKNTVLKLYPNPSSNMMTFELVDNTNADLEYKIFDIKGALVQTVAANDNVINLSVADLNSGTYMVVCSRNGNIIATSKFIKQ